MTDYYPISGLEMEIIYDLTQNEEYDKAQELIAKIRRRGAKPFKGTLCSICQEPAEYRYVWDRGELPYQMMLFQGVNPIYRCAEHAPYHIMRVPILLPVRFVKDEHVDYVASHPEIHDYRYERVKLRGVGGEI